jgi:hypothetical protein
MNSKQRVHAALRRQPVDRIPIFMWFHAQSRAILAETLEIPAGQVDMVIGNDVRMTWVNNNAAMEGVVHEQDGEGHIDEWGIHRIKEGPYNQIARFPLANCTPEEVRAYHFPLEAQEALLARMERRLIDGMTSDGGGYILAASHTIPPETPMENIFAMYAEAGLSREVIFDRAAASRAALTL